MTSLFGFASALYGSTNSCLIVLLCLADPTTICLSVISVLSPPPDTASVGEEEFRMELDSASFQARLAEDEAAVQEANKFLLVSGVAAV